MNPIWLYASVLSFICVISIGTSLKCYNCGIIEGVTKDNPCQRATECQRNSVCVSSSYTVTRKTDGRRFPATVKSCALKSGKECEMINANSLQGYNTNIKHSCNICEEDGCNRSSGPTESSIILLLTVSIASVLWYLSSRS